MLVKMLNLGKSPKKVNVNKEISEFIKNDFGSHKFEPAFKLADFGKIKAAIDKGLGEDKILKIASEGEGEDRDVRVAQMAQHFEQLRQSVPVNLSVDLFGIDEREPSDFEKSKFIRSVRVLQDPGHILELMRAGSLTGTEVDALELFYPEYAQSLKEAILEQIAELQGKDGASMSRQKNNILSLVLGVPRIAPEALDRLQQNLTSEEEKDGKSIDMDTEATQTDIQQTLNRNV